MSVTWSQQFLKCHQSESRDLKFNSVKQLNLCLIRLAHLVKNIPWYFCTQIDLLTKRQKVRIMSWCKSSLWFKRLGTVAMHVACFGFLFIMLFYINLYIIMLCFLFCLCGGGGKFPSTVFKKAHMSSLVAWLLDPTYHEGVFIFREPPVKA